ncbi:MULTISPECIES: PilZ domain-containing protein [Shewanella]|uniref:PilZ domain-containing protein n=1 Tax=Shewanella metallivivens TaxID=2872342 RepID=A0ABT5TJL3_9GAMM|nr:PilZ domain-containing protein [Shewanella metallivivens]MDD8058798.1 PilZ domain-containing protein [Shewanella metallivivens]
MSLDNHSALIEQLKPLLMEPDFQEIFEQLTADESNSTRFLLKMELNRISSQCTRIIDLRDKTELPCEEVVIANQRHFLDEPAKESLINALPLYRNKYTLGVYEQVVKAHKLRRLKLRNIEPEELISEENPYLVPGVVLGSYFNRCEERMNYSIRIAVNQPGVPEVNGVTLDLSVGGARIKLPLKHHLDQDKPIKLKLLELSEEFFVDDLQHGVDYQIVDIQNKDGNAILRLKRLGGGETLDKVISKVIRSFKFRYKVDVNDVIVTATGLGYERHYLPLLTHLPLYISVKDDIPHIAYELLGRGNQPIQHYFQDENEVSQLPNFLNSRRLTQILKNTLDVDHCLLFSFTHHAQGKLHFYSASLAELKATKNLHLFLGFASTKASWRVFKVVAQTIDHSKNYKTSTLPGDDARYSALTEQQLAQFSHTLQLIDLTNEDARKDYQGWFNKADVNGLKIFAQAKVKKHSIKKVSMPFSERRHEARFAFKTLVTIQQGDKKATGVTHDISSRGLQLILEESVDFTEPAQVMLSFPRLQAASGKANLAHLPYQLIRSRMNGQTLHLSALIGHTPHDGVEFLNKLIAHNKQKLEQLSDNEGQLKELADGLKNLFMRQLPGVPYFIEKTVKSAQMAYIGIGTTTDEISHLFAQDSDQVLQYNLRPLLDNNVLKQQIIDPIKAMKPSHDMDFFEVFIQLVRQARGSVQLKCVLKSELGGKDNQVKFIQQSKKVGRFMALRVYRGATDKPDMSYIRRELEYIHIHANHRAKHLEEQLWKVIGSGELLDITAEVEIRYPSLVMISQPK